MFSIRGSSRQVESPSRFSNFLKSYFSFGAEAVDDHIYFARGKVVLQQFVHVERKVAQRRHVRSSNQINPVAFLDGSLIRIPYALATVDDYVLIGSAKISNRLLY